MELEDRVALVTGGAVRVGRTLGLTLAAHGAHVVINYHQSEEEAHALAEQITTQYGRTALAIRADVSQAAQVTAMFQAIEDKFGRLDLLVNNAAIFYHRRFADLGEEDFDVFINTNLKGVYLCSLAAARLMQRQGGGKIINLSDVAAEKAWPGYLLYCVSKAGVVALTRNLAAALAPAITVNAIAPGIVLPAEGLDQASWQQAAHKSLLKRAGTPEDVARALLFVIASDFMTGAVVTVDGGRAVV